MIIFVAILSAATVAIGFAEYFVMISSQLNPILFAVLLMLLLSFINFYGISESIKLNTAFTFIELAGLVIVVVAGFWLGSPERTNYFEIPSDTDLFEIPPNVVISVLLSGTGLIFFAYYGFENIVNISEETKSPTRVIPLAGTILYSHNNCHLCSCGICRHSFSGMEGFVTVTSPTSFGCRESLGE